MSVYAAQVFRQHHRAMDVHRFSGYRSTKPHCFLCGQKDSSVGGVPMQLQLPSTGFNYTLLKRYSIDGLLVVELPSSVGLPKGPTSWSNIVLYETTLLIIKSVYIVVSDPMKYSGVATLSGFLSGEFDIECVVKREVLSLFELQMGSH
ncbi:hypothetical protein D0Y65_033024 [Glycine soja]|nr:hypothetical protein D0Y65_033024 [Glycine soja]